MKKAQTLFNPIVLPGLVIPSSEPSLAKPEASSSRKKSSPRKRKRPARPRRVLEVPCSAVRFASRVRHKAGASWQRIKGGLHARLARLDPEKLKRVLVACGIAATVALLIIALSKLTPLLVALLAVLGLSVLLRVWDRLRVVRIPF